MGFFLLRRDGDTVALIVPTVFSNRHEALAEMSRISGEGALDADEVFVVDLDSATPVLILAPPPSSGAEMPSESVEDLPVSDEDDVIVESDEDASVPDVADLDIEPAAVVEVEEAIAEAVLADAELPIEQEPEAETEPVEQEFEEELEEEPEPDADDTESAELAEAGGIEDPAVATPEPEPVAQSWPWDTTPEVAEAVGPMTEVPVDEEDELPEEVSGLLADLEEIVPTVDSPLEEEPPAQAPSAPPAAQEDSAPLRVVEESPAEPPAEEPASEEPSKGYEAGASDITTLTCDDCIYLNTCPKKGESDPSSCGSFQWRSV
jgi:hypothetical protein